MKKESTIHDLKVWQKARELAGETFEISNGEVISADSGIKGKMRSLALTILSNITKGYERRLNKKEFSRYLGATRDACFNYQALLYLLVDVKLLSHECFEKLKNDSLDIVKMASVLKKNVEAK